MCRTSEDTAKNNPQIRYRTEPHTHDSTKDRSCTSNIQELNHKYFPCWQYQVIDTIKFSYSWSLAFIIRAKYALYDFSVNEVA